MTTQEEDKQFKMGLSVEVNHAQSNKYFVCFLVWVLLSQIAEGNERAESGVGVKAVFQDGANE